MRQLSRREAMEKENLPIDLPECDAPYLVDYLFEAGPATPTGMGLAPLAWCELQSWQLQTGLELQPWELRLLRRLSRDYANESAQADDPDRRAPDPSCASTAQLADRQMGAVLKDLAESLRSRKKKRPKT